MHTGKSVSGRSLYQFTPLYQFFSQMGLGKLHLNPQTAELLRERCAWVLGFISQEITITSQTFWPPNVLFLAFTVPLNLPQQDTPDPELQKLELMRALPRPVPLVNDTVASAPHTGPADIS